MVLLGLSILVASCTYLLFRYPPFKWSRAIEVWRRGKDVVVEEVSAQREKGNSKTTVALTQIGNTEGNSLTLFLPNGNVHVGKSYTPKPSPPLASETEFGIKLIVPTVTLDSGENDDGTEVDSSGQRHAKSSLQEFLGSRLTATVTPGTVKPASHQADTTPLYGIHNSNQILEKQQPENMTMPPPSRASTLRPLHESKKSLNPPLSLASTLRAPSLQASKVSSSGATSSTLAPSARRSKKVVLPPGHSPLDWAHLIAHAPTPTFLRGNDVPTNLIRVTPSQLRQHNGRKGKNAWGTWQGKVYNLTPYLKFHPGGEGELMRGAGRHGDAERMFLEIHPWVNWEAMLGECLVGILVGEHDGAESTGQGLDLEAMD